MAGLDLRRLTPADAAAALRSFPRRFRTLLTDLEGEGDRPDDLFHRPGRDGVSALAHAQAVVALCQWGAQALHAATVLEQPELPALPAAREPERPSVEAVLAEMSDECEALADRLRRVPSGEWNRPAITADGKSTNALGVIRSVVAASVEHLRAAELTVRSLKGR